MIGQALIGLLLTGAVLAPHVPQPPVKPAAVAPEQDPAEKPWPQEGVFRPGQGVTSPEVIYEVKPRYTAEARRARIEGIVEVQAIVEASGDIGAVRVVRSLDKDFGLDNRAIAAVREWRFKPGKKDGE